MSPYISPIQILISSYVLTSSIFWIDKKLCIYDYVTLELHIFIHKLSILHFTIHLKHNL